LKPFRGNKPPIKQKLTNGKGLVGFSRGARQHQNVEKEPMKKTTVSAACYRFAAHLSKNASPESLEGDHLAMNASADDLKKWKISRQEWSMAFSAAAEARRTGRDPADFLKSTQDLLNSLSNTRIDAAGNQRCEFYSIVGGGAPRNE
jgi:hypothetical protein